MATQARFRVLSAPLPPPTDIELSYLAALIDGLRLINERAGGPGNPGDYLDCAPLLEYVQVKGKQIHAAWLSLPDRPDVREVVAAATPKPAPKVIPRAAGATGCNGTLLDVTSNQCHKAPAAAAPLP